MIEIPGWSRQLLNLQPAPTPRKPKEGRKKNVRVVGDLVTSDIPIRDEGVVGVSE